MAKNLMVLYGINSVRQRLISNPSSIRKIFLEDSFRDKSIEKLILKYGISCQRVSRRRLQQIKSAKGLQKIAAKTEQFRYLIFDEMLESSIGKNQNLIFLDNINDPQNIGVIIRTLACLGGFSLVLPQRHTCGINDTVIHVASGGENYVPIAQVSNLAKAVKKAQNQGYTIIGSMTTEDAEDIREVNFRFPVGIILGSESDGIRKVIRPLLDMRVYIPMEGAGLSLNVNNACAIFCYSIMQKRKVN